MQKDPVTDLLASVEKDCTASNILICYGSIEENELSPISNLEVDGDWNHFLKVLKALQARVLVIEVEKNENRDYDLLTEQINSLNDVAKEEVYSEALSDVRKNDGKMAIFTISFPHNLINYQLKIKADWYDEYELLESLYLHVDDDDDDIANKADISDEQIDQIARLVANSPRYVQAKTSMERRDACLALNEVGKLEFSSDRVRVIRSAETIFLNEVFPVLDNEIGLKIRLLKAQGLNKSQVKAKLNISTNTLYRHWDPE